MQAHARNTLMLTAHSLTQHPWCSCGTPCWEVAGGLVPSLPPPPPPPPPRPGLPLHVHMLNICPCTHTKVQFGRLENLKKLVLQGIKLSNLHHSIGKLRNLQSLSLQHNNLYDLPFTLEWLEHLEYLDISGNFFTILPRAVYHLRGLKVLKGLNSCPLIVKPEWRRSKYRGWSFHRYNTPAAVTLTQPQTLQDAALRSALGINCWKAGLPTKCCLLLTESEISTRHDMCENCNKPTRRVMPDQEPEGNACAWCGGGCGITPPT